MRRKVCLAKQRDFVAAVEHAEAHQLAEQIWAAMVGRAAAALTRLILSGAAALVSVVIVPIVALKEFRKRGTQRQGQGQR